MLGREGLNTETAKERGKKRKSSSFRCKTPSSVTASQADLAASAPCSQARSQVRLPQHSGLRKAALSTLLQLTPQSGNTPARLGHGSEPASRGPGLAPVPLSTPPTPHPTPTPVYYQKTDGLDPGWWSYHRGWEELFASSGPITSRDLVWLSAVGIVQNKQKPQAESKYFRRDGERR